MSNILEAISAIVNFEGIEIAQPEYGNNRVHNAGYNLELLIKRAFINNFSGIEGSETLNEYSRVFSFQGSKTRPPDLMLRNGDAIEIKKTESLNSEIQLNSSYPKSKLYSSSGLINRHCRECEPWTEKDIFYIVGHNPPRTNRISSLWFIQGSLYAADEDVYLGVKEDISSYLQGTSQFSFSQTDEIGRVNLVDPLEITNLRIRGMWLIKSPKRVFEYVYQYDSSLRFQLMGLISNEKYVTYPESSRSLIENSDRIVVSDVRIKNPNNPVQLINSKLIVSRFA